MMMIIVFLLLLLCLSNIVLSYHTLDRITSRNTLIKPFALLRSSTKLYGDLLIGNFYNYNYY